MPVTATSSSVSTVSPARRRAPRAGALRRQPERPGRVGIGALHQPERERSPASGGHPVVALRLGPDGDRRPAAGRRTRGDLARSRPRGRRRASARSGRGRRRPTRRQVDRGGVEHAELGVRHAELRCPAPRRLDHLLRDVGRTAAVRPAPSAPAREKAGVARARSQLEDRLAGLRVEQLDQALRERRASRPRTARAAAPSRRRRVRQRLELVVRAPSLTPRARRELRDHVRAVRSERLLLAVRHQVDRVVVDADRLELAQLRRDLLDVAEHGEAVADLVGDELAVARRRRGSARCSRRTSAPAT